MHLFYEKKKKSKTTYFQNKRANDTKQRHNQNSMRYIGHKTIMGTTSKTH